MSTADHHRALKISAYSRLGLLAIVLMVLTCLAAIPGSLDVRAGWAMIGVRLLTGGTLAAGWLAAALGFGEHARRSLPPDGDPHVRRALTLAFGAAVMLLGGMVIGQFSLHPAATLVFWLMGWLGLGLRLKRSGAKMKPDLSWWTLLVLPATALLLVAACLPPGTIWRTEAHGYDVLSYHLQLPKEWLTLGRIVPLEHNVYSFLPGAMESAYAQLASVGSILGGNDLGVTLVTPVHAAQFLHAGMMLAAAYAVWALVRMRVGTGAAWIASAMLVSLPWVIVTGSEAYNEGPVLLGLAASLLALATTGVSATRRGVMLGMLAGMAVSAKPTAAYMVLPSLAIAGVALRPRAEWLRIGLATAAMGLVMCLPWLIRNWLACGNPVFPYATDWFGTAHWTSEQVARWQRGHSLSIGLVDRLARLFSREHGLLHVQWSVIAVVAIVGGGMAIWCRDQRRIAVALAAGALVQVIAWLFIGHLQSRFLITLIVPGAMLTGLGLGMATLPQWRRFCEVVGVVAVASLMESSVRVFLNERGGEPNIGLVGGVEGLNGHLYMALSGEELQDLGADPALNVMRGAFPPPPDTTVDPARFHARQTWRVYLLGDATPLYIASDRGEKVGEVVYHTTWDRELLGDAVRAYPDDPHQWVDALASRGITHVLINVNELRRLQSSGWYEPAVTPEVVLRLVERLEPMEIWAERGQALYSLTEHEPESR